MPKKSAENGNGKRKWPENCIWPEPTEDGSFWEADDAESLPLDDEAQELLDIKEYFDELVKEGRLNEDYSLNEDDEDWEDDGAEDEADEADDEPWAPEKGSDYWDDGFDVDGWTEDLNAHLNLLKLPLPSPVDDIQRIIGHEFINENLIRQAFTRRAFALEYGIGDSEGLELIGDAVLNTVVTREISRQLTEVDAVHLKGPFRSAYHEGDLSRIRQHYVCKEYLSDRATALGLDKFILYGSGEVATESSREDAVEALIGAVAADSDWDWYTLEAVVDRLLTIQLSKPSVFLRPSAYDTLNAWHQKKFGRMPEYEVSKGAPVKTGMREYLYSCTLRYTVPENDKGIRTSQRVDVQAETRSKARELAANEAYCFVMNHGLWMNLKDAGLVPKLENSINQLQELYQKKYVEQPEYTFEERDFGPAWYCSCSCNGIDGWGKATGKTAAKKKAAFMVLVRLMMSAGLSTDELEHTMWKTLES